MVESCCVLALKYKGQLAVVKMDDMVRVWVCKSQCKVGQAQLELNAKEKFDGLPRLRLLVELQMQSGHSSIEHIDLATAFDQAYAFDSSQLWKALD